MSTLGIPFSLWENCNFISRSQSSIFRAGLTIISQWKCQRQELLHKDPKVANEWLSFWVS